MWFILALVAIFFWSGSDLFTKMGSDKNEKYTQWKIVIAVGLVMGIHAGIELLTGAEFKLSDMITYLPASSMYILSMIIGYIGLRYLVLSVSTPICNCSGAVAAVMCYFFLGDELSALQIVAVCFIMAGIILLSVLERKYEKQDRLLQGEKIDKKYTHSFIAIFLPITYCIIDALGTFFDGMLLIEEDDAGNVVSGVLSEESANIAYELTFFLMAIICFIFVYVIKREKFTFKSGKFRLTGAICETAGQFAYIYAIAGNTIAAAPMISSYCLFSVVWARIIIKEKLTPVQYVSIGLAGTGIILMGVAEGLAG